ncbi:hypothetical protein EJ04DRAFT_512456 [Polyplosphaeria fusca]|uniref:Uncharacterized protein n=1 Tax=Polyplosphaeria fusca TaxID=682080 RepID=A0A9P4V3M4_9PLEO|nr:hypothetical protein EJ04DRAFT_512456 [Polyplosphaeria fusca]
MCISPPESRVSRNRRQGESHSLGHSAASHKLLSCPFPRQLARSPAPCPSHTTIDAIRNTLPLFVRGTTRTTTPTTVPQSTCTQVPYRTTTRKRPALHGQAIPVPHTASLARITQRNARHPCSDLREGNRGR